MNDLLNHPHEVFELLRRVRGSEHEPAYLDQLVAQWKDPDNVPLPSDDAAEQWERYCLADGINLLRWASCDWGGTAGQTLELTDRGVAALLMWERSQQAEPQAEADKSVATLPPCDPHFATEDELPAEFREGGNAGGKPLSREYLEQSVLWCLKGPYLARAVKAGKLTRNAWVGVKVYHNYTQLLVVRDQKKDRTE